MGTTAANRLQGANTTCWSILSGPIACHVTPADLSDRAGARKLLTGLALGMPRLKKFWADAACRGKDLADWRDNREIAGSWSPRTSTHQAHAASACNHAAGSLNGASLGYSGTDESPRTTSRQGRRVAKESERVAKDDESPRTMNAKCRPARRSSRSPQSD